MSIKNIKKILLAGTALVAVSAFSAQAQAATFANAGQLLTAGTSGQTWAQTTAGAASNGDHSDPAHAQNHDSVNLVGGGSMTVTNNNTADDGSGGVDVFVLGDVTNSAGTGTLTVTSGRTASNVVTVNSASLGTAVAFSLGNFATTGLTAGVTGNLTSLGTLAVDASADTNASATGLNVTVGGNLSVTSTTNVKSANVAGAGAAVLTVTGNSAFGGLLTVTSSNNNAGSTGTVNLNGATNTFAAGTGVVLDDNTAGLTNLKFNGTVAQTVSGGDIKGNSTNEGAITVNNAAGVTFANTIGAVNNILTLVIEKASGNSSATLQNTTSVGAAGIIKLGTDAHAGDTNTLTLDGTTQAFTATGVITGTATETDALVVKGGKTITLGSTTGTNLDTIQVTGTGTKLTTATNIVAGPTITVDTGATLETTNATVTPNITLTGTLGMAGGSVAGTVDGSAAGTGTLAMTVSGATTGNVGTTKSLAAITVATGAVLTASGDVKATTTTLSGTGTLALTAAAHGVTTNIAAGVNGDGSVTLADGAGAVVRTITMTGDIGSSSNKIATLTLTDGSDLNTVKTTGNLYVNATTINTSDTLQFIGTNAQTVSGTIATGGAGRGAIVTGDGVIASNVTFNGTIGAGGNTVNTITTNTAATANFAAATTIASTFTNAGTSNFSSAAASTLTGAVTNTGTLNANGAGLITTGALTNSGNGVVHLVSGNLTSTAALTNNTGGTITLDAGRTLTANTQVAGTGTYNFGVSTDAATGLVKSSGQIVLAGPTDLTNGTINVTVPSTTGFIASGKAFKVVGGVGNATTPVASNVTAQAINSDNSRVLSFTYARGDNATVIANVPGALASEVYVIANRVGYATISTTTANDQGVGAALDAIAGTGNADLDAIQGLVNNAASDAAVHNILESLTPTVDGSSTVTALSVGSQVQGLAETRIASLRTGDAMSGVAAGAAANGWNMWLQGYGQHGSQDAHGGVQGYDADTLGGAVGVDTTSFAPNSVIGLSFNYGKTNSDSKNVNTTSTDVDNYGFNLYGSYDLGSDYFTNGQLGYAYNKITTDRHNATGPGLGVTANGDTNSNQYMAKLAFGRDFNVEHGLTLTPTVSAAYTHLTTESYTETGAGGANLNVGSSSMNALNLAVGVNAGWTLKNTDGSVMKPAVHAGYSYEALNDRVDVTSSFTGDAAGTAFTTQGPSPDRSALNVGLGLTYMTTANFDLSANYDYTYKANYDAHTGTLRATSHF